MFNESPKVLTTKVIKEMVETNIDTRTFGEIYKSLNEMTQFDLREKIKSLSYCTEAAIRNWRNGHRRPEPVHQANIVKALKAIGIRTSPATLFPKR